MVGPEARQFFLEKVERAFQVEEALDQMLHSRLLMAYHRVVLGVHSEDWALRCRALPPPRG